MAAAALGDEPTTADDSGDAVPRVAAAQLGVSEAMGYYCREVFAGERFEGVRRDPDLAAIGAEHAGGPRLLDGNEPGNRRPGIGEITSWLARA